MKKTMKKLLALLLALSMCLSLCAPAWAAEQDEAEEAPAAVQSAEDESIALERVEELPEAEEAAEEAAPDGEEKPVEEEPEAVEEKPIREEPGTAEETSAEESAGEPTAEDETETAPAEEEPEAEAAVEEETALETQDEDPYETAQYISTNSTVTDALEKNNKKHYYRFTLPKDGAVSLTFNHEYIDSSSTFWIVGLYNQSRELIRETSFDGNAASATSSDFGLAAGTYYLCIRDYYFSDKTFHFTVNYSNTDIWEREFNGSFYLANEINVNQEINGSLMKGDDKDYYVFHLSGDGAVSLSFTHPYIDSSSTYWRCYLYNSDQKEIDSFSFDGNTGDPVQTKEVGLAAGTYYLMVQDYYHSALTYQFKLNYTPSDAWEKEFNESFYASTPMAVNTVERGSLRNSSDVDYYQFTTEKDGFVTIQFQHNYIDSSSTYWRLYFYNADEEQLSGYDYEGNTGDAVTSDCIGIPAGTYYIKVDDYYFSSFTYQFQVNFTASDAWETEFNHSFYTADPIKQGKTYTGTIMNGNDVDYYKITLKKQSTISYSFQHPFIDSTEAYWKTGLYDADGNYIIGYDQKGNTGKKLKGEGKTLKAGTYYLKVSSSNRHSAQPYKISIIHRHSYTKKITKKPTLAAKGTAKYTCKECGDSYTKSVPKLKPTGVSSFRVERVYDYYYTTKHEIKFTWTRNKKADGYVIQACQNSDFSGRKSLQIKGGTKTTGTLKLKSGGYYHCRIKAYQKYKGKVYYSDWHTLSDNGTLYVY